jgi:putative ABC transport system permease protein
LHPEEIIFSYREVKGFDYPIFIIHTGHKLVTKPYSVPYQKNIYWLIISNSYFRHFIREKNGILSSSHQYITSRINKNVMLKNYLKIAWRNITRNKVFSFINMLGLALGMTCCLFIFLWVKDEKSIDNFHKDGKDLYTVYQTITANGQIDGNYESPIRASQGNNMPVFLMEDLKDKVPEVRNVAFYATGYELPWGHPETLQVGEKIIKFNGSRAGEDFLKMFSYPVLAGDATNALETVNSVAISRKVAEIFFKTPQDAIGKTIRYENRADLPLTVTAVFENIPKESSLQFDFLLSWQAQKSRLEWASNTFQTYVQLASNANTKIVESKINQLLQTRMEKSPGVKTEFGLQLFGDMYLKNVFVNGKPTTGRIEYVRIFSGVAIFILLIACINFMNLATARSMKRAKEVGLRKVVGSSRGQLIAQFYGESMMFAVLSMLLSILFLFLLLPAFNYFTQKHIDFPYTDSFFWTSLLLVVVGTGLIAGSYPALYLSSLQPVRILKGVLKFTSGSVLFRKGLTVFQFILSIVLLIATIIIVRQTDYIQTTDLGYNRENLVYIRIEGELSNIKNYLLFKQQASQMPGIAMIDRSTETPQSMNFIAAAAAINWEGKGKNDAVGFNPASVGFDFVKLMKLKMAEGRDFSMQYPTDSTDAFLVNEEAVKQMGMKNPIGKWVSAWAKKGHIVGVLKDYHTRSLHDPILPVMLDIKEGEYFGVIIAKTKPGQTKEALASLEKVYKEINPKFAFAYQFVDEEFKKMYSGELIVSKLSVLFATLAILISCLGLLGLVIFAAEQRTKEIGIRKVLGASIQQIVAMFSKDFVKLILIAFVIAAPIGWYIMNAWLRDFTYRINVTWWTFGLALAFALIVAFATISYQAIKAAIANPVKSLRSE